MRWFTLTLCLTGCATATEQDVLTPKKDSGVDTTPAPDTTPVEDTKPTCTGACEPGKTRESACGFCGKVVDTCDPDTCTWTPGKCSGEGACEPGVPEETACATTAEVKSRTCSATCTWSPWSACAAPSGWHAIKSAPTGFEGRAWPAAVWTGSEMILFGGKGTKTKKDGAAYDPVKGAWRNIAAPPTAFDKGREQMSFAYGAGKMMVWGGLEQEGTSYFYALNGAVYDVATDTWKMMSASPLTKSHTLDPAVWTGKEMIVWGNGEGAAYDPVADTWQLLPAAPISARSGHKMVWTGSLVLVWSGCPAGVSCSNDGASYDPATKTWAKLPDPPTELDGRYGHAAHFEGSELIVWGGYGGTEIEKLYKKTGARYSTVTKTWTPITPIPTTVMTAREGFVSWFDGKKLFAWSGADGTVAGATTGGAIYDVAAGTWSALPSKNVPLPRRDAAVVWTGKEAIVWGGWSFQWATDKLFNDGAVYRP